MPDLKPLIAYLIDQVNDQGGSPNKTALVKLVYLVDVECQRRFGRTATGLPWRFHHYGPYSAQLERDINDNEFVHAFGNQQSGFAFRASSNWRDIHRTFEANFEPGIRRIADGVVRQWGLEDLNPILEYVYFETEPMQEAQRGDTLDFSTIQPEQTANPRTHRLSFSDEFLSDLRERWDQHKETVRASNREREIPEPPIHDQVCKVPKKCGEPGSAGGGYDARVKP